MRVYCFSYYLFKGNNIHQDECEVFSTKESRNWHRKEKLDEHISGLNSVHNQAKRNCDNLMQQQSIGASFDKQFDQTR